MQIEPATAEWLEALVDGDDIFETRFGIAVVRGWAGFPEAVAGALATVREHGPDPWGTHLFFDADGALVGFGGFKGAPVDGMVEIGYAIAPDRRGRGLATAAARAMIERARAADVRRVLAHTLAEENASGAVLVRCGFRRTATVRDPALGVDGETWRWELDLDPG